MIYTEMNISGHKLSRGAEPTLPVSVSYSDSHTLGSSPEFTINSWISCLLPP